MAFNVKVIFTNVWHILPSDIIYEQVSGNLTPRSYTSAHTHSHSKAISLVALEQVGGSVPFIFT